MDIKKVGQRIRETREEKGITRKWIAQKLDVSYNTVQRWENGHKGMSDKNKIKLCQLLDANLIEVFYEELKK